MSKVLQSAKLISVLTLVSRILGLVRDIVCAHVFGTEVVWSAFRMGFQIPNLFRRLFGEGALSAASIPVLTETLARESKEATDVLAGRLLGLQLAVLAGLCVIGECVVVGLYWVYGGDSDNALTLALTALMLPYMILICTAAVLGGVQNVFGRFASPAAAPIILNIFMIAAAWLAPSVVPGGMRRQIVVLAAAVVVSGMFQLAWQWLSARQCGLRLPLRINTRDPNIRRICVTMLPMMGGLAAVQLNTLMDTLIAWWFVPGRVGPGILGYAQELYQFPLGVFAIALATAIFPTLARHVAEKDTSGLKDTLARGMRVVTFEALPCMVGLILVRDPLVRTLFERGQFAENPDSAPRVAFALYMYALGIIAYGVNHLLVRTFYAMHDAKTPMKISLQNVFINLAGNLILVNTVLREAGLALSTSICAVVQAGFLGALLQRRIGSLAWGEIGRSVARSVAATVIMAAAVLTVDYHVDGGLNPLYRLVILVCTGGITYLGAAFVLGCQEMREMLKK
ncbi:MAG: murein biosynthesis integral membrane protein MurJ [Phycisphaerae bacterium]